MNDVNTLLCNNILFWTQKHLIFYFKTVSNELLIPTLRQQYYQNRLSKKGSWHLIYNVCVKERTMLGVRGGACLPINFEPD